METIRYNNNLWVLTLFDRLKAADCIRKSVHKAKSLKIWSETENNRMNNRQFIHFIFNKFDYYEIWIGVGCWVFRSEWALYFKNIFIIRNWIRPPCSCSLTIIKYIHMISVKIICVQRLSFISICMIFMTNRNQTCVQSASVCLCTANIYTICLLFTIQSE